MDTSFLFQDCYTGTDFENKIVEFLSKYGFMAQKTGSNDGGIDIAVKSGTSVFNADSRERQEQNFLSAQKRAGQAHKAFVPVVGYGYGRKKIKPGSEKFYMEIAGQDFWEWLTGDAGFYIKIVELMGTRPDEYAQEFKTAYDHALNRMTRDFTIRFCNEDGSVKWDELLKFNSGSM